MQEPRAFPSRPPYLVFYDASCPLCRRSMDALQRLGTRVPLRFVDSSDPANLREWPQVDPAAAQHSVIALDPQGRLSSGFNAVVTLLAAAYPVLAIFAPFLRRPPFSSIGEALYRWVASHRYTISKRVLRRA